MNHLVKNIRIDPVTWLYGLLFVGIGYAVWQAHQVIILILTAIVISIFVEGSSKMLSEKGINRTVSIIFVYILFIGLFGFMIYSLVPVLIAELATIKKIVPSISQLDGLQRFLDTFTGGKGPSILEVDSKVLVTRLQGSFGALSSGFLTFFNNLFGNLANFVLLLVLSLYLALEERGIERLLRVIIPSQQENYAVSLWNRVRVKVESWFRSQLVVALITGVVTFIGLSIMKVPYSLLLALMAGLLGMIPFGILIATIPAIAITLIHKGVIMTFYVLLLYGLLQQVTDYIITPQLVKRATGLPSLVVIISFVLSVALVGFLGFFLAVPFAILGLEIVADIEKRKNKEQQKKEEENFETNFPLELVETTDDLVTKKK